MFICFYLFLQVTPHYFCVVSTLYGCIKRLRTLEGGYPFRQFLLKNWHFYKFGVSLYWHKKSCENIIFSKWPFDRKKKYKIIIKKLLPFLSFYSKMSLFILWLLKCCLYWVIDFLNCKKCWEKCVWSPCLVRTI